MPGADPDRAADERAIRDTIGRVTQALNARDYAGAAAPVGEEGDLVLPGAGRVTGGAAAEAEWSRAWSTAGDRRIAVTVKDIRSVGPDVAMAELTAEFSSATPARDRVDLRAAWGALERRGPARDAGRDPVRQAEGGRDR